MKGKKKNQIKKNNSYFFLYQINLFYFFIEKIDKICNFKYIYLSNNYLKMKNKNIKT